MGELFDSEFLKKLETLSLKAKHMLAPKVLAAGEQRSRRHGSSVEFADFRQYTPGDDFRRIDWNAYARFENLFLKLFRQEQELNLAIICDASASMNYGTPNKFDYARQLAGAIAYIGLNSAARVNVQLVGAEAMAGFPGNQSGYRRGRAGVFNIFRLLENAKTGHSADISAAVEQLISKSTSGGIALIISDMFDSERPDALLKLLAYQRYQPMVVHTLASEEISPQLSGDLKLTDIESSQQVEVSPTNELMKLYHKRLNKFRDIVRKATIAAGGDYLFVPTDTPLEKLVTDWMRRASMLG